MIPVRHVVYECVPGAYAGGVQKMVFELASAQCRLGADVEIWAPDAIRAGSTESFDGLPIRYFYPNPLLGLARSFRLGRALRRLPRGTVVHAHNSFNPLNLQVGRAAQAAGLKAYYHPHGALDPALFSGNNFQALKKRFYIRQFSLPNLNRARGVFALTPLERNQLTTLGLKAPVYVVPNGIRPVKVGRPESGQALREKHGISADTPVILFVGRITTKKRLEDVILALSLLGASSPHLLIAGSPNVESSYATKLFACVKACGHAARVHWLGFLDEQAKAEAYAAADVFVHASDSEGMALAILEAMDAGLPVVATRGCYMTQAASAGALVQCEQGPEALARALAPLVLDRARARAQGQSGQAYVRKVHDWETIARATLKIYEEDAQRS